MLTVKCSADKLLQKFDSDTGEISHFNMVCT